MKHKMIIGIIVTLIGLSLLLRAILGIDLPILKIAFGLMFLYFGVKLIAGDSWNGLKMGVFRDSTTSETRTTFQHARRILTIGAQAKTGKPEVYQTAFGSLDLDGISLVLSEPATVEITTLFGETRLTLPAALPIRVKSETAFGKADLPGGASVVLGEYEYESPNDSKDSSKSGHRLTIHLTTVFGSFRLIRK